MAWDRMERRRFVRVAFPCRMTLAGQDAAVIVTTTRNLGVGGLNVITPQALGIGQTISLELTVGSSRITCCGKVVWVLEKSGAYDVGMEFHKISDQDRRVIAGFVDSIRQEE